MTTVELIHLPISTMLSVQNEPFRYIGKASILLEGGDTLYWLYDENGNMISIHPETEEIILFHLIEEEYEIEEDSVLFNNDNFDLSYQDKGTADESDEGAYINEKSIIELKDFQKGDGEIFRLLSNIADGEETGFVGAVVLEEDIIKA